MTTISHSPRNAVGRSDCSFASLWYSRMGDNDEFSLVRRHAEWLRDWFRQYLGYQLVVEPGFARLAKTGLGRHAGRPLQRSSGGPFTPRAYAYLSLALAVLVTGPDQILLSQLVTDIRSAAVEADIPLGEPSYIVERRALTAELRRLVDWGVLIEEQGAVSGYAEDASAEALVTIDRDIARHLVGGPIRKSRSPEELIELAADPEFGGPRHYVRRRMVETPVVYVDDLTAAERGWLRREQRREERVLSDVIGLRAEIRAEGVAVLDPEDELSDIDFPGTGTASQAALLTIEKLTELLRAIRRTHRRRTNSRWCDGQDSRRAGRNTPQAMVRSLRHCSGQAGVRRDRSSRQSRAGGAFWATKFRR